MTHFPQPHPTRRAARVQLRRFCSGCDSSGRRTPHQSQTSNRFGHWRAAASRESLAQGDFVEVAFQTQAGPVHGMAEVLSPMRSMPDGVLQPFRFVALEDDDHRRLRNSLDHVAVRSQPGNQGRARFPLKFSSQLSSSAQVAALPSLTGKVFFVVPLYCFCGTGQSNLEQFYERSLRIRPRKPSLSGAPLPSCSCPRSSCCCAAILVREKLRWSKELPARSKPRRRRCHQPYFYPGPRISRAKRESISY